MPLTSLATSAARAVSWRRSNYSTRAEIGTMCWLGVTYQRPELQPEPRLAAPRQQLTLGNGVPLALALPEHHEKRCGIGRDMAVDRPRRRRLFDRERPIVENPIDPAASPQAHLIGGLQAGRLISVDT